tara:strand:+ start:120466 stop:120798 length:333 start_codon:yes stop_codon:yes gene_type:complete
MITVASAVTLIGFYFLYSTSKRADLLHKLQLQKWIAKKPKQAKTIGFTLLFLGLSLTIITLGWGSGTFSFLVILMTIGSLTVLISPLRFFSITSLIVILIAMLFIELYLY